MTRKQNIPKAVREQCWIASFGKVFEHKCYVDWCDNIINVFDEADNKRKFHKNKVPLFGGIILIYNFLIFIKLRNNIMNINKLITIFFNIPI